MKTVIANITWLKPKGTSGQPIISETPYRPVIIFKGQYQGDLLNESVFSAEIFNEKINKRTSIASLTLRSPHAPVELMIVGAEFELYEASKKVAYGIITE